ncbi:MAG: glycosyltransferase family 2 protein [Phocaeicola sp.]|uniref:glycosyltransferase family 2 protein n=1 Tax=Phocaeicola TaxID=909656 RepID=UPI00234E745A|nr:glycosyltransferase family 2 protein [Phocaeicola oris]MCE2616191.1 glycosyltransferase family 2 protein [Phocaeicola oris]
MKKVSIVILNWNGEEMLRSFLPSVCKNSEVEQGDVEICVADNGSTDGSLSMLEKEFPSVRQIVFDKNYGFAEGYNKALQLINAEYVVLLNSDVEVTVGWLRPMVKYLDSHPNVAACQPKILSQLAHEQGKEVFEYAGASGGYIDEYGYPFCRGRIFNTVEEDHGQYNTTAMIFWASGASLFVRLSDYWAVGGLDGRFFAHMEEIDFCWRLRSRGKGIVCIPESVVYHVGAATLKKENPKKTYLNFRNNLLMLYKNLDNFELHKVLCFRWFADRLAALVFFLKGHTDNASILFDARRDFYKTRYGYASERAKNMISMVDEPIPEQAKFSILFKYYIGRKKRFSQLKINS